MKEVMTSRPPEVEPKAWLPGEPHPAGAAPADRPRPPLPSLPEPEFDDEPRTTEINLRLSDFSGPQSPALAQRALLIRMDGVHAGLVVAIESFPFTIGRHATNALRIDEESISRFHARLVREDGAYYVEDLGSRNGTFVAGERVTRRRVEHGTWLGFGAQASFRFTLTDAREERLFRKLYESSTRDALTGAYNRLHFDERLRAEIAFAARHSSEASLVLLDIDHFKRINDTYGHPAGDLVLSEVARLSMRSLRTEDVFARFGGEEFAVILRGIALAGARKLGERLRIAIESTPFVAGNERIHVTLSAGCASLACCTHPSPEELVRIADRRLYLAKERGRNQVVADG
nr:MAG: GGDEF domain-containing protein [Pseudomonadota bacterium]